MGKRRPTAKTFDTATETRLAAIGPYELVTDPGYCEIHFSTPIEATSGLPEFEVSWFLSGPSKAVPVPDEGLFALWEKYSAAHVVLCESYRRLLFDLFSRSEEATYTDRQWQQLRRSRPTEQDLRSTVSFAKLHLSQAHVKGDASPQCEAQAQFGVFWNSHGIAVRLQPSGSGLVLGEWSGIGEL